MHVVQSIIATNAIITLADGSREALADCAIESAARQINEEGGRPFLIEHDWLRLAGWTERAWAEREGETLRLVTESLIPENSAERGIIWQKYGNYLSAISDERTAPFKSLAHSLKLPEIQLTWDTDCVYLQGPSLARRLCPSVFSHVDKDGLVSVKDMRVEQSGWLKCGDFFLVPSTLLRPGFDLPNAPNRLFLSSFLDLAAVSDCEASLSLDADRLGIPASLQRMEQRDYWWGPHYSGNPFDQSYGVTVHGPTRYDRLNGLVRTEFWWYGKAERTFEVEELIDLGTVPNIEHPARKMRFVHSIFDNGGTTARHLDGAVRMYSDDLWRQRTKMKISEFGKKAQRVKLWRVDGRLSPDIWYELIHMFFRGNFTIAEYFGLPGPGNGKGDVLVFLKN